ncbi:MAG: hypothetical protein ABSE73_07130 [Planctomycetota bacterium]
MLRASLVALGLILPLVLVGAEIADMNVSHVYIPAGRRSDQVCEFIRQLNVAAFIDLGRGWEDKFETLSRFSFKDGTVVAALDDYCRTRPFQWHEWRDAGAIWVEPKVAARKAAEFFLRRPITALPHFPDGPITIDNCFGNLHYTGLEEMWKSTAILPAEENRTFECPFESCGFGNHRDLTWDFLLRNRKLPTNMLETAKLWLAQAPACTVGLVLTEDAETRHVGLALGSSDQKLPTTPIEGILAGLCRVGGKGIRDAAGHRFVFERELYRRIMVDRKSAFEALRKSKTLETDIMGCKQEPSWAVEIECPWIFEVMGVDPDTGGDVLLEVFQNAPADVKRKMIRSNIFSFNARRFESFWQTLSHSDDKDLQETAKEMLKTLELEAKEARDGKGGRKGGE